MPPPPEYSRSNSFNVLIRRGVKMTHLQLVAAIAETGQVLSAAEKVGMTQPAASRLLAQLEKAVGAPIFRRHLRGVKLTEVGEILAKGATRMLSDLDLTQERIDQTLQGAHGIVRIGSVTGPSMQWLLPTVRDLRAEFPQIELTVHVDTSVKLTDALLSRELDFFLGRVPDGVDPRPFRFEPVSEEPIALVVRRGHPLSGRTELTLDDCLDFDWVMQPPGGLLRQTTENYLVSHGFRLPERTLGTTSTLFTLALVHDTDAIAPLARAVAEFYVRETGIGGRVDMLDVAPDLRVKTYGLVRRIEDEATPAAERVIRQLMERAPTPTE
ncbi:DNA-binding transcriptional regulator, LysR family [Palleronia salina]|uniref:DNA-binding transcriptional regulator, LysR family n=1 Tax=Palleronia salina TaxID=313368 RepID=A0A1M6LQP1_9RHOB|nr:LysR substrate-binding domain-containing protein [Palleronia salina]SHJ73495.1 DNA-binding transcriptional regulator, LysR family [Palleronia salina]